MVLLLIAGMVEWYGNGEAVVVMARKERWNRQGSGSGRIEEMK